MSRVTRQESRHTIQESMQEREKNRRGPSQAGPSCLFSLFLICTDQTKCWSGQSSPANPNLSMNKRLFLSIASRRWYGKCSVRVAGGGRNGGFGDRTGMAQTRHRNLLVWCLDFWFLILDMMRFMLWVSLWCRLPAASWFGDQTFQSQEQYDLMTILNCCDAEANNSCWPPDPTDTAVSRTQRWFKVKESRTPSKSSHTSWRQTTITNYTRAGATAVPATPTKLCRVHGSMGKGEGAAGKHSDSHVTMLSCSTIRNPESKS